MAPPRPSSRVLRSRSESVLDALTRRPCERHRGNRIGWLGPKASPAAPSVQRALPRPQPRVDPGGCPPGLLGECVLARSRRHRRCSSCSVDHASESVRLVACASRQPSRVARSNLAVRRTNPAPAGRGRGVPCGLDRVPLARPTTSSRSARSRRRTVPFGPAPRSGSVARRRCCHPLRRRDPSSVPPLMCRHTAGVPEQPAPPSCTRSPANQETDTRRGARPIDAPPLPSPSRAPTGLRRLPRPCTLRRMLRRPGRLARERRRWRHRSAYQPRRAARLGSHLTLPCLPALCSGRGTKRRTRARSRSLTGYRHVTSRPSAPGDVAITGEENSTSWVAKAAVRPDERELVDRTCATRGPRAEQARRDSFPPSPRPLCPALLGHRSSRGPFPSSVGESSSTALPHREVEPCRRSGVPSSQPRWAQHVHRVRRVLPPSGRHAICRSPAHRPSPPDLRRRDSGTVALPAYAGRASTPLRRASASSLGRSLVRRTISAPPRSLPRSSHPSRLAGVERRAFGCSVSRSPVSLSRSL